jgi:hypothetical protein
MKVNEIGISRDFSHIKYITKYMRNSHIKYHIQYMRDYMRIYMINICRM